MADNDVPDAAEVTAEWLAAALRQPSVPVITSATSIGTGQVGENVRFVLEWPDGVDGPTSLVGKFPSLDETSRNTAAATGSYVKEVGFYRDLQRTVSIRTPRIHGLREDLDRNRFVLLMEDIRPAEQGDQLAGCPLDRAALAVDALAGLHGPHWGGEALADIDWLVPRSPERATEMAGLYGMLLPGFLSRYDHRLDDSVLELGSWFARRMERWFTLGRTPITLVHGDYRLDNMLFGTGPDAPPITIVDWQTLGHGRGPTDLAYFIGAGLHVDDRQNAERDLVARYVERLAEAGVDAGLDDVWHDYVLGSASGYVMAVIASQIVGQTERGDEMFCIMAERHARQMQDLDLASLLE